MWYRLVSIVLKFVKLLINPSLVIVYGDMIEGMFGTFINFRYVDGFNRKYEQLSLFNEKVFTIMGGK